MASLSAVFGGNSSAQDFVFTAKSWAELLHLERKKRVYLLITPSFDDKMAERFYDNGDIFS